ncbi:MULTISPECIES: aminotransferase class I/II-fold pyridoxal phosphate-dependent enzyme [unclassified Cobetia]|uniref:aminotransferase class I/II-fold pyridoxal phosphate-dependent enzyme n=1 Tax=unclassified Cobetia TaxID=2609414 RepID=UPI0020984134|nr:MULTISPECIES: aminotransferase class I/II-fold pyridoxal phosphate-dependent enzyme [unclassified Cobetia]MCO7233436.1 aminotransferase class I/II-fold pyridoxal phosphate-dependent enzyme [Cobetia sp. Dlab-2-AX]MCO7236711.1 aminotransferase class I/II-fold pyridoxal phosphate-dependent enzyme [Cobetia sp. Dlab-2-U]
MKQQLLDKARARRTRPTNTQSNDEDIFAHKSAEPLQISDDFVRFDRQLGYQQLSMMQQAGAAFGVPEPFFRVHDGCAGATTRIEGRELVNFASYNYLDYSRHPEVVKAAAEAAAHYGTSVSASRAVSGERPIHQQLEAAVARTYDVEDAVVFVSGHATNVSTLGYLLGPKDLVLHDEWIHNSSLVGAQLSGARRMPFAHNDPDALEALLRAQRGKFERVLIVTEGLYSMDGDVPDLPRLIALKHKYRCWLMVDEAHSFGVLGERGLGLREHFDIESRDVDIWMGTMSKTLSGCGGYIAGCKELVSMLRYFAPGFLYSVGMPAQVAAPSLKILELLQGDDARQRIARLHAVSGYFLQRARALGLDVGDSLGVAVVPVILGSSLVAARLSNQLFETGFNVQPILHPAVPEKSARLRFFLSCEHTEAQVDAVLDTLMQQLSNIKAGL